MAGGFKRTLSAAMALATTLLVTAVQAADIAIPDGVLILHSNQRPTLAGTIIDDALRTVLSDTLQRRAEVYSEYLDAERFSAEAYAATQAAFLGKKYGERNIRVIVASAPQALQFSIDYRDRIHAGVPVVFVSVPGDVLERMTLAPGVVGTAVDFDPAPTLELALRLQPDAKRLVLVTGAADRDRIWEQRLHGAERRISRHLESEYLAGLPTADVLRRLRALTRDTIVFTPGYFVDGAGQVGTPRESVEAIARASAAPVYGPLDSFIGTGIVGGAMATFEDQGKAAGATVVRLLNGAAPAEFKSSSIPRRPLVDLRQIRRWDIDERLLPDDTIVRFREATAGDKYRREISAGIAIVLFQAVLIAMLLVERRLRRRTATALLESQEQMNLAARAARLSIWIWDAARDSIRASKRWRRTGMPQKRMIAFDDVLAAAHPDDREELNRAVRKALTNGDEIDVEYRVAGPGGNVRWIAARGRAEQGDGERMMGVALDITGRKEAEIQSAKDRSALTHMTRVSLMGQLSASIAHQLNQPLAAILGNAEAARKMLGRESVDLVELKAICDDIVTEDNRAAEVIRRLGALYKRGEMKMAALDLNDLVRETLDLVRTELMTRHVASVTDLAPALPKVAGGRVQLQQVLLNLVLNAADAMGGVDVARRKLTVRTGLDGANVRLCVVDQGTGIEPGDIKNVFDAFWSTKAGGIGVGLAICQSIISAHRGSITVANNPDGGTTFCATWPVRQHA